MKYIYLKLTNYIGIYNGMGLYDIEIDFSKSTHKVCVIKGTNGSGKSTIMNALSVFPDSSSSFIPGLPASKVIRLLYNGKIYEIKFFHEIKNNGLRDTTKAYISKQDVAGNLIELNPNGNVSQYRDIVYSEFQLDSNFATLSRLSMDDRGIGYMKPAERKRFVNSIIESLNAYNEIYKVITKRVSSLKAVMNSIVSRLGSIGDEDTLNQQVDSVQNELNRINRQRDLLMQDVASLKADVNSIDPDGAIQQEYSSISKQLDEASKELHHLVVTYQTNNMLFIPEVEQEILNNQLAEIADEIERHNNTLIELRGSKSAIADMVTDSSRQLSEIDRQISSIKTADYMNAQQSLINAINRRNDVLSKIQCTGIDPNAFTKDEYILALETVHEIVSMIDIFRSCFDYSTINECISAYRATGYTSFPPIKSTNQCQTVIDDYDRNQLIWYNQMMDAKRKVDLTKVLDNRPNDCTIDSCYFIHEAVEASKGDPESEYNRLREFYDSKVDEYTKCRVLKAQYDEYNNCLNQIHAIIRSIDKNGAILSRLPNGGIFTSKADFFEYLVGGESFTFIERMYRYIDLANYYEEYHVLEKEIVSLEKMVASIEASSGSISQLENTRESIKQSLFKYKDQMSSIQYSIDQTNNQITVLCTSRSEINTKRIPIINRIMELIRLEREYKSRIDTIQESMNRISSITDAINKKNIEIAQLDTAIGLKHKEREGYVFKINQLITYKTELADYEAQFALYDKIRYHSSPTTGIQLVFMQMYMGRILQVSNTLLRFLFDGKYVLQPFIINEMEFRIPCLGEGYINDDISSMSSSQSTMISMILSFALLYTSSTEYNIIKLDEIDDPLDEPNRAAFAQLLNRIMEIMGTEQCIMISHSSELIVENADLILLKSDGISSIPVDANVIWDFNTP